MRLIRTVSDSSAPTDFEIRYTLRPGNVQDTPKTTYWSKAITITSNLTSKPTTHAAKTIPAGYRTEEVILLIETYHEDVVYSQCSVVQSATDTRIKCA